MKVPPSDLVILIWLPTRYGRYGSSLPLGGAVPSGLPANDGLSGQ